jgi:hypothetical protein
VQILAVFEKNVYRLFFGLIERKKNGVPMHPENVGLFVFYAKCGSSQRSDPEMGYPKKGSKLVRWSSLYTHQLM